MDKYTGKKLDGRYEIQQLIGVGGMAVVYRAYDTIDDRVVAVKILKDEFLGNEEFIRRFKNESKAIAVLSHPNIVKVFDVSFGDRIQYIVMEYIDGITLKEYIDQQKNIKWKEAVHFCVQILRALQHAHEKGIVHRDIKPQNIMLLQDGTIKVTDFGIARFSRSETRTMTEKAIGSVHYIAPEQARGDITDEKADLYSVGVMLYEMITGQLPFEADNAVSVAIMQLQSDPRPPRDINPAIPDGLEEITLKAMQKDPSQRYQSAAEMLRDIEQFRRNPSIRFQYKYFIDEKPTKYIDAINSVKASEPNYDDNYNYDVDKEAVKEKTPAPYIIGGIAAAFLIFAIVFGMIALFRGCSTSAGKDVPIPNLIGQKIEDVKNNKDYKFDFNVISGNDPTKDIGIILDQDPKSSTKTIKETATITLTVNGNGQQVPVPDVVGKTEQEAIQMIKAANLLYEEVPVYDDQTAKGYVQSTDPQAGTLVPEATTTVKLRVSQGPTGEMVPVPNVIGKSLETAVKELEAAGLTVGNKIEKDDDSAKGTVLETDPLVSTSIKKGASVTLTISNGKKTEKTVSVYVNLPTSVNQNVNLVATLDDAQIDQKTVNPNSLKTYQVNVKGTTGKKTLTITLDGQKYKIFAINFDEDDGTAKETQSYNYQPPVSSSPASSTPSSSAPPPAQGSSSSTSTSKPTP